MRIAIAGKGGSGKTTIAGTLARSLARSGRPVLAIDADSNPNLATVLGLDPERSREIVDLPRDLLEKRTGEDGVTRSVFAADPDEIVAEYAVDAPDGIRMLVMGTIHHSGAG
ncbi:MAG: AAA family ATPase [Longimicrobiales bacterium]|nr:AAA family ATPase [Longimicrobiales bacterium]